MILKTLLKSIHDPVKYYITQCGHHLYITDEKIILKLSCYHCCLITSKSVRYATLLKQYNYNLYNNISVIECVCVINVNHKMLQHKLLKDINLFWIFIHGTSHYVYYFTRSLFKHKKIKLSLNHERVTFYKTSMVTFIL